MGVFLIREIFHLGFRLLFIWFLFWYWDHFVGGSR